MIARSITGRIARLERYRRPGSFYVLNISTPPTSEELAALEQAKAAGRRFAVLPRTCGSVKEWLAFHAPRGELQ
jgi:hypothetical protein